MNKEQLISTLEDWCSRSRLDAQSNSGLPMKLLQSGAFTSDESDVFASDGPVLEMLIVGKKSKQGTRTSGAHVNCLTLAGVLLTAVSNPPNLQFIVALLVSLFGSCTVSITPEQSAFFLACQALKEQDTTPTANAIAETMQHFLGRNNYTALDLEMVVHQLKSMGVQIKVGASPNKVIRYEEATIFVPSL